MKKLALPDLPVVTIPFSEEQEQIKLENWNHTVESITRNMQEKRKMAWSRTPLEDDQVTELKTKGYEVSYSVANNCHRIEW